KLPPFRRSALPRASQASLLLVPSCRAPILRLAARNRAARGQPTLMGDLRRSAWVIVLLISVSIGLRVLLAMLHHGGVAATRAIAATFLLCDLAVSTSLLTLLIMSERRAPLWVERRLPFVARWLWYVLMGLAVLGYMSL